MDGLVSSGLNEHGVVSFREIMWLCLNIELVERVIARGMMGYTRWYMECGELRAAMAPVFFPSSCCFLLLGWLLMMLYRVL